MRLKHCSFVVFKGGGGGERALWIVYYIHPNLQRFYSHPTETRANINPKGNVSVLLIKPTETRANINPKGNVPVLLIKLSHDLFIYKLHTLRSIQMSH